MLSGHMLPIHFPPAPDELLSSWYVRLAHANRLKAETFGTILWSRQRQIWNRDIDRLSPEWLVKELADRTGTPFDVAWKTTLKSYEGKLFPKIRQTGISPWILPVQMYHRKHKWPGLQFCPVCLKEDEEPYFRKRWRLSIYTKCHRHNIVCMDHCPSCQEPIMFHRIKPSKSNDLNNHPLSLCHRCNFDLRQSISHPGPYYDNKAAHLVEMATSWLEIDGNKPLPMDFYIILHQTCRLLISNSIGHLLQPAIIDDIGVLARTLLPTSPNRAFFEHGYTLMRHQVIQFSCWLISNKSNLISAMHSSNIKINKLYKDLAYIPAWYISLINRLPHRDIPMLRNHNQS